MLALLLLLPLLRLWGSPQSGSSPSSHALLLNAAPTASSLAHSSSKDGGRGEAGVQWLRPTWCLLYKAPPPRWLSPPCVREGPVTL
eukprot:9484328-Pyramimonas_sp.AAC.3